MSRLSQAVGELIEAGWNQKSDEGYEAWSRRVVSFLTNAVSEDIATRFRNNATISPSRTAGRAGQIGVLEAVTVREEQVGQRAEKEEAVVAVARAASLPRPSKLIGTEAVGCLPEIGDRPF